MNIQNNITWLFGIFAVVALFSGSSFIYSEKTNKSEMIQFADLSDADINLILAVKAKMDTARINN